MGAGSTRRNEFCPMAHMAPWRGNLRSILRPHLCLMCRLRFLFRYLSLSVSFDSVKYIGIFLKTNKAYSQCVACECHPNLRIQGKKCSRSDPTIVKQLSAFDAFLNSTNQHRATFFVQKGTPTTVKKKCHLAQVYLRKYANALNKNQQNNPHARGTLVPTQRKATSHIIQYDI